MWQLRRVQNRACLFCRQVIKDARPNQKYHSECYPNQRKKRRCNRRESEESLDTRALGVKADKLVKKIQARLIKRSKVWQKSDGLGKLKELFPDVYEAHYGKENSEDTKEVRGKTKQRRIRRVRKGEVDELYQHGIR